MPNITVKKASNWELDSYEINDGALTQPPRVPIPLGNVVVVATRKKNRAKYSNPQIYQSLKPEK